MFSCHSRPQTQRPTCFSGKNSLFGLKSNIQQLISILYLNSLSMYKLLHLWLPVILWAALIFTLSSFSTLPSAQKVWWDYILKKGAHMFEYAVLYFLVVRALEKRTAKNYTLAFVLCIAYAISDEFHQSFTPGRTPKPTDVGFDTIGMTIAYLRLNKFI